MIGNDFCSRFGLSFNKHFRFRHKIVIKNDLSRNNIENFEFEFDLKLPQIVWYNEIYHTKYHISAYAVTIIMCLFSIELW